jgi:hypothetical protein
MQNATFNSLQDSGNYVYHFLLLSGPVYLYAIHRHVSFIRTIISKLFINVIKTVKFITVIRIVFLGGWGNRIFKYCSNKVGKGDNTSLRGLYTLRCIFRFKYSLTDFVPRRHVYT